MKPDEQAAVRWTGENDREVLALAGSRGASFDRDHALHVNTGGGGCRVPVGYWVVRDPAGNLFVRPPAHFADRLTSEVAPPPPVNEVRVPPAT